MNFRKTKKSSYTLKSSLTITVDAHVVLSRLLHPLSLGNSNTNTITMIPLTTPVTTYHEPKERERERERVKKIGENVY